MEISIRTVMIVIVLVVVALVVLALMGVFGGSSSNLLSGLFGFLNDIFGGSPPNLSP